MRSPFKTGLITVKNADGEEVSMTTPIDTNPKRRSFNRIRSLMFKKGGDLIVDPPVAAAAGGGGTPIGGGAGGGGASNEALNIETSATLHDGALYQNETTFSESVLIFDGTSYAKKADGTIPEKSAAGFAIAFKYQNPKYLGGDTDPSNLLNSNPDSYTTVLAKESATGYSGAGSGWRIDFRQRAWDRGWIIFSKEEETSMGQFVRSDYLTLPVTPSMGNQFGPVNNDWTSVIINVDPANASNADDIQFTVSRQGDTETGMMTDPDFNNNTHPLTFGGSVYTTSNAATGNQGLVGYMKDVNVWGRALTAQEITNYIAGA
tara:strand:- start:620 stop:1576 length:957 start_codon:yes stop_codon:yes gene_type:complete